MPEYLDLDLQADAPTLQQEGRDYIESQAPAGYTIDPLVDWILGAVARMAVLVIVLAGRVPRAIFRYFGVSVLKIPLNEAVPASTTATFTLADTDGHTIPAGTQLDIDGQGFITTADLTITAGLDTGSIGVIAINAGTDATDLAGDTVQLVSPTYIWVDTIALDAPTDGGVDGETDDEYVDRLADELPTLSPKAILIGDFEALARRDPEVVRAVAIDNFVPPSTTGVEGAVTVALQDAAGEPVSPAAKDRVEDALEADRVLPLDVHVIDPTYTDIDVTFDAEAYDGYDADTTAASGEAAITQFLSPATWGNPSGGPGNVWVDEPTVRRNDLLGVLYAVPGIRHVNTLTLAVGGGSLATADVALTGPAALPRAADINGTVS